MIAGSIQHKNALLKQNNRCAYCGCDLKALAVTFLYDSGVYCQACAGVSSGKTDRLAAAKRQYDKARQH